MNEMQNLRILSHGKVSDLSGGFSLGGRPFSIFVRAKALTMELNITVNCKLICERTASDLPVPIGDWTPAAIAEISPNAVSLDDYDVYWGAGETI